MSLTDIQIKELARKMRIPLVFCDFKDRLKNTKLQYNKFYILNMENEFDEDGKPNDGTHWTCFQINKYPNGKIEGCYFDSFGVAPPEEVKKFCSIMNHLPYNTKDVQSLMNSACGWYCLAFGHFINSWEGRSKDLYTDCSAFTDLYDDLNKVNTFQKNEYILKMFFRPSDPDVRAKNPVEIFKPGDFKYIADPNTITKDN